MKLYKDKAGVMVMVLPDGTCRTKLYTGQGLWCTADRDLVSRAIKSGKLTLIGNNYKWK